MATHPNPSWWKHDYDSAWDRVKEAFRRDWTQTKHDMKRDEPDLNQDVGDTVRQATGSRPIPPGNQPNFDADERAHRFGYGAREHYGSSYAEWNDDLERQLRGDWGDGWDASREAVRRGWTYRPR